MKREAPLRAVIFDVDGVLVQSMEKHYEAYRRTLAPRGIEVEPHMVYANEGRRSREVLEAIARDHDVSLSEDELAALNKQKQETFMSLGPAPFYPGVPELIDKLHGHGLRVAMVTGTAKPNVRHHMGDFVDKFEVVVTADDVTHTKPHPEPYQAALGKLGVEPREAVIVENAVFGIRSGKAAGVRVIGVASTLAPDELGEADVVVARISEVLPHLESVL